MGEDNIVYHDRCFGKNILICQTDLKNHILTKKHKTGMLFVEKDIGTIRHQRIAAKLDLRVTGKPLNLLQ